MGDFFEILGFDDDDPTADPRWDSLLDSLPEAVETVQVTSKGAPVQVQGLLADGRYWHFRARGQVASLGLGRHQDEAVADAVNSRESQGIWYEGRYEASCLDPAETVEAMQQLFTARGIT